MEWEGCVFVVLKRIGLNDAVRRVASVLSNGFTDTYTLRFQFGFRRSRGRLVA
jgi:hypothetical protein